MSAVPRSLPKRYRKYWRHPWYRRARASRGFKRACLHHGKLSPNFSLAEARCNDGTNVPQSLLGNAQRHAFNLERFRHQMGDKSLSSNSWYRTPSYNRKVGGASQSRHMSADATDFTSQTVAKFGRAKWYSVAERVFRNGGVGDYPVGSTHLDSRGWRARWRSY